MKRTILCSMAALMLGCLLSLDVPKNWFKAGSAPENYSMGIAAGSGKSGGNAATIQSITDKTKGFGTLMQNSLPGKYLGKKVRMTGWIKSADVKDWAGLWFRIDGESKKNSLAFDNMYDRRIKGTTDWKQYEIILDVPNNATNMAYGALISGKGQIWFDDIRFEIVNDQTPSTGMNKGALEEPANLNFDEK